MNAVVRVGVGNLAALSGLMPGGKSSTADRAA